MLIVPYKGLSEAALLGVLDDYINREGTDYGPGSGEEETSLQQKRRGLLKQLEAGTVVITFDPVSETTTLISATKIDA